MTSFILPEFCGLLLLMGSGTPSNTTFTYSLVENSPPVVTIKTPADGSVVPVNTLLSYSIDVSDQEDGESKYDEIPADRIFLEIRFVKERPSPVAEKRDRLPEHPGLSAIRSADCFTCHQFNTRFIGPSFSDIAHRYKGTANSQTELVKRIQEGSQNIWGTAIMPAHKDLPAEDCHKIVSWILETGPDPDLNYQVGKSGAFRTTIPDSRSGGYFILSASYTDNGLPGQPGSRRTGRDSVVVMCR